MIIQIKINKIKNHYELEKGIPGARRETCSFGHWTCDWKEVCKRMYEYLLTIDVKSLVLQIEKEN